MPTFGLIVCRRRFPNPKYFDFIQPGGEHTFRPFPLIAKRPTATAATTSHTSTKGKATATFIEAKPKNSTGANSDFVSTVIEHGTAPNNKQDPTTTQFCSARGQKSPDALLLFDDDRTLGATLSAEHYASFRRPLPLYDKTFCSSTATTGVKLTHSIFDKAKKGQDTYETGPATENFNNDRTLGATLSAEHYAAFRQPPTTYDKFFRSSTSTNIVKLTLTFGATLRKEHYEAFRRPPPTRDKPQGVSIVHLTKRR